MAIAANRHPGIRAAVLHDPAEAAITRQHNNANVACLGARFCKHAIGLEAVRTFLRTAYEGGRHDARLAKLQPPAPAQEPASE